ncbi:DUF445 domain-containing protein, partial [Jatrophihabitans endophyticus]|uniref:DUF445 domain-containing protein n=1 Tax=Jatrophihabitans endophyticus TaxID=1206085 RepID=UPI001A035878
MTSTRPRPGPSDSADSAGSAGSADTADTADGADDEGSPFPAMARERLSALRRMKAFAGGLLLVALVAYVVARAVGHGNGAWGYLQAAAEASMVGGLADWFAVTALFRHPLRLPIPHTAIIPSKKDQIGEGLATFVRQYFLTTEILSERVEAAQVPQRVGDWLADPEHARRLAQELSNSISGITGMLREDQLRDAVAGYADRRLRELDVSPLLSRLIDAVCDSGQHQVALTSLLRGLRHFLDDNRALLRTRVAEESPEWVPVWVDERVFAKGFSLLQTFLADVTADPEHGLRHGFDAQLRAFAQRLRDDPDQIARVEATKLEILDHPAVHEYLGNLWGAMKTLVLDGATDPDSDLRRSAEALTVRGGEVLRDDPAVRTRVNEVLQRLAGHVATHYAEDLTDVISSTVARWDTDE